MSLAARICSINPGEKKPAIYEYRMPDAVEGSNRSEKTVRSSVFCAASKRIFNFGTIGC
jgi:hypothetical protein